MYKTAYLPTYNDEVHFSSVGPRNGVTITVTVHSIRLVAGYKYTIFSKFSCQMFFRLIFVTATITLTSITLAPAVAYSTAALIVVVVVSQVQPLSAISLVIVIVMLFVMMLLAVATARGIVPAFRLTASAIAPS